MRRFALVLAGAALGGCRGDAASDGPPPPPPPAARMAEDLVGARFAFFEDEQGEKRWTIEEGEVRDLRVLDGTTADDGKRHRARVRLTLAAENRTIRGDLDVYYRRDGAIWAFDEVARAGPNWAVEELAAVVFEARAAAPSDTAADARDVWLEPMFRYHDGAFEAPLDDYRGAVRTLLDSAFASDSARRAAVADLESEIARRYLSPAWTVFLLAPGAAPAPVRIRTREASFDGCEYVVGGARAPSPALAEAAVLATSSSTMGGAAFPGRAATPPEEDALAVLARARLAALGAPIERLERLRAGRALAVDLDGDGTDEIVGSFGIAGDLAGTTERAVVVVGRPAPGATGLIAERGSTADDGWGALELVGALDVDGDGDLEVVAREAGYEVYRYVVLARRDDGAWSEVYAGGGGGC